MTGVAPETSQAPDWLAYFLWNPPLWFRALLVVATGLCIALAARRVLRRDLYISPDEQRSMILILATAVGVAAGVILSMAVLSLGYAGDVLVGMVSGFAAVEALRYVTVRVADQWGHEPVQLVLAWIALFIAASGVNALASAADVPFPGGLDIAVGGVTTVMVFWVVIQEGGQGDTLGEALREAE